MFCLGSHVLFWLPALQGLLPALQGLPVAVQEGGSPLPVVPHQFPLLLQARVDFSLVLFLHRLSNNIVRELNRLLRLLQGRRTVADPATVLVVLVEAPGLPPHGTRVGRLL